MNTSTLLHDVAHPYYPLGAALPGHVPNSMSMPELVLCFAMGCAAILATTRVVARWARPGISNGEVATTMWFVLCGCIHFFFEGYFALHFNEMPTRTDLFGQLWKEYSLSDSRYLTKDAFTVCMEAVTALFWGPLSFAIAYCIVARHPLRHPLQLIASLGQLYGDVLYYATFTFTDVVHNIVSCRPENFYFFMYYIFCNAFWIVIPSVLVFSSTREITRVFAQVQSKERAGKKNL